MEQANTSNKAMTVIQGRAVRTCELRLERRVNDEQVQERIEYVCGASGGPEHGYVLARNNEDLSPMLDICNHCPIPDALEHRRACLNLVPVRAFSGNRSALPVIQPHTSLPHEFAETYFTCRWFYTLYGQKQPHNISMCLGCPHWFPRPPHEMIPDYWPFTHKMLRIVTGEEPVARPSTGFTPATHKVADRWWQRLLHTLHL